MSRSAVTRRTAKPTMPNFLDVPAARGAAMECAVAAVTVCDAGVETCHAALRAPVLLVARTIHRFRAARRAHGLCYGNRVCREKDNLSGARATGRGCGAAV
jgi:hypothetical protein